MNTNLLDLNNDVLNIIGDYVKKDNNERIQDYEFLYYVITELLYKLKFDKLSKHKMGQIIYSELVNYYHCLFNYFELRSKIVSLIILNFVQKLSFLIFLNIRSGVISFGYPLGPFNFIRYIITSYKYFYFYEIYNYNL